ncbi:hypothetical protein PN480_05290, partial [Dolichospermum circinale CS-1225]
SNIKSLSFSSPRCGGIEGGARRGLKMYLIRAETPVYVNMYISMCYNIQNKTNYLPSREDEVKRILNPPGWVLSV